MHRGQPSYVYTHTDKDTVIDKAIYDTHLETTVLTFQTTKLLCVEAGGAERSANKLYYQLLLLSYRDATVKGPHPAAAMLYY